MTSSRDGRPRSCPMQIVVDGRVWRYQTGLTSGAPVYVPENGAGELAGGAAAMLAGLEAEQ